MRFADLTTLGVGGPLAHLVRCETETELVDTVRRLDEEGEQVLLLGGGSNILAGDGAYHGTVVQVATTGVNEVSNGSKMTVTVAAGEPWDAIVSRAVAMGWSGIEALSGIPGLTGATAIQNVGAYGQEVSQSVSLVRALDRSTGQIVEIDAKGCAFGYRTSAFKSTPGRWLILSTSFVLSRGGECEIRYGELAAALGVDVGSRAPSDDVRSAVQRLRAAKGMLLDPMDADTRSAGSFFTNPILTPDQAKLLSEQCPRYASNKGVKVSAAWLIEQAGIGKGWRLDTRSRARVSTKHTLAIVSEVGAQSADVIHLAQAIRQQVADRFEVNLEPEPTLVNCSLTPA